MSTKVIGTPAEDGSWVSVSQGNVSITIEIAEWDDQDGDGDLPVRVIEQGEGYTREKTYSTVQRAEGRDAYWVGDFQSVMATAIATAMDKRADFLLELLAEQGQTEEVAQKAQRIWMRKRIRRQQRKRRNDLRTKPAVRDQTGLGI